jgi:hypothetical protein
LRAIDLFKEAAVLGEVPSMYSYGELAFVELDWERFYWWGRAATRRVCDHVFRGVVLDLLPSFEKGEHGRILHTVAPVIERNLDIDEEDLFGKAVDVKAIENFERVIELHAGMLGRAKAAIACWSMAARRLGVVKDMRVMIGKMAWEEAWMWSETETPVQDDVQEKKIKRS